MKTIFSRKDNLRGGKSFEDINRINSSPPKLLTKVKCIVEFPNGSQETHFVTDSVGELFDKICRGIENSTLSKNLWESFPNSQLNIPPKLLFGLSTCRVPGIRNGCFLSSESTISANAAQTVSPFESAPQQTQTGMDERVFILYFMLKCYPPDPISFPAIIAVHFLQQLVFDVVHYEYLLKLVYGPMERYFEEFLKEYKDYYLSIAKPSQDDLLFLRDIAENNQYYGYEYFPVILSMSSSERRSKTVGFGLSGIIIGPEQYSADDCDVDEEQFIHDQISLKEVKGFTLNRADASVKLEFKHPESVDEFWKFHFVSGQRAHCFMETVRLVMDLHNASHKDVARFRSYRGYEEIKCSDLQIISPENASIISLS